MMPLMAGVFIWTFVVLVVFGVAAVGLVLVRGLIRAGESQKPRLTSPEDTLRDRYARGEIGRQAYLDAVTDVLKDRYVRGELTAEEYEERLGVLLAPGAQSAKRLPPR